MGLAFTDRDDIFVHVNPRLAEISGYTCPEMLGRSFCELLADQRDWPWIEERMRRRLVGIREVYEVRLHRKDGSHFWAEVNAVPFRDSSGEIVGSLATFSDITDRKEAFEALRRQREFLEQVIDTDSNLIFTRTREGVFTLANKALADLYQTTPGELLGRSLSELIADQEELEKILEVDRKVIDGGVVQVDREVAVRDPRSGETRWYQSIKRPLLSPDGREPQVLAVFSDVTERRRHENILRALVEATAGVTAQDFFRSLVRQLAHTLGTSFAMVAQLNERAPGRAQVLALWLKDHFVEAPDYEIAGTPSGEICGQELKLINGNLAELYPQDPAMSAYQIKSYIGAPVFSASGKPLGILAVMHDQPVEDLASSRSVLTILAARAGAEIERLRVEQEKERLQRLLSQSQRMEAIGQLVAGITHDLNNSLGAVIGHLELMKVSGELSSQLGHSLEVALAGCERASTLMEQLRGFARPRKCNMSDLAVQKAVSETIEFLEKVIDRSISITLSGELSPVFVRADYAQLQQVFTNLIINAAQAMPDGGRIDFNFSTVHLDPLRHLSPAAGGTDYVVVSISDTGCGIGADDLEKIFQPFFTTKPQGTGLGLSMVYGVIKSCGGWIEVDSQKGLGTTFTVYLPQVLSPVLLQPEISRTDPKPASGKILIIDDEIFLVELAVKFLSLAGFEAEGFSNPLEAVEWFEQHRGEVDLVIIDMKMPQMNGAACFAQLRKVDPGVKVVILSGFVEDSAAHELLEQGALKFFQKPLKYPELVEWIAEFLGRDEKNRKARELAALEAVCTAQAVKSQTGVDHGVIQRPPAA